ncbi:hypothetical protein ACQ4M3_23305 [Leptolyngbya sp. AN03gr2]
MILFEGIKSDPTIANETMIERECFLIGDLKKVKWQKVNTIPSPA